MTDSATLLAQVGDLLSRQGVVIAGNLDVLTGTIDDPDSVNATGGKDGALGFYPIALPDGATIYFPCLARMMAIAAGSTDPSVLNDLLSVQVAAAQAQVAAAAVQVSAAADQATAAAGHASDAQAARDQAAADAARFLVSGIQSGAGKWMAPLPEGLVQIFAPFVDANDKLLAGIDPNLNWLVNGLRVLLGGSVRLGDHTITGQPKSDYPFQLSDANGNTLLLMDRGLRWLLNHLKVYGTTELGDVIAGGGLTVRGAFSPAGGIGSGNARMLDAESNYPWSVHDAAGNVFAGVYENDFHLMHVGPSKRIGLLFDDVRNLSRTAATFTNKHNLPVAALDAIRALFVMAGQSISNGYEAWPALSKTARSLLAYMIDLSVRPANGSTGGGFTPEGGAAILNPLIATVEHVGDSNRVPMSDAAVAAIDPAISNTYEGESPIVGIVNGVARYWSALPNATARKLIAASTGYGGHAIEQLQQGRPEYARTTDLLNLTASMAATAGETWNVPSLTLEQGQANCGAGTIDGVVGGTPIINDKAGYKAQLKLYRDNFNAQLASRGQTAPPAMFIHVTSGSWLNDTFAAAVPMAQVEFALETPGVFVVGPSYAVTDKGGHLDSNGSRWMGVQSAKVQRRVLLDRMGHEPFYPYKIETSGRWIYIHMGGAVGPVQFQPIYAGNGTASETATMFADKGYRAQDANGFLSILSVEAIGSTIIGVQCDRVPDVATGLIWYADRTLHVGGGNLCDSDPTRAEEIYEYLAGTGMYSVANIAALVGQPYPLWNWCSPYVLPLTYSR